MGGSIVVEKTIVTKEVPRGLPSRPLTQPRETNEVASLVKKQKVVKRRKRGFVIVDIWSNFRAHKFAISFQMGKVGK